MSLLTSIKDSIEILQSTSVNDGNTKELVFSFLKYAWYNSQSFLYSLLSLEWFRNVIFLPLRSPETSIYTLANNFLQGTGLTFVEASALPLQGIGSNNFVTGFLNSFFVSMPFSCAHFIFLRRLFVQGIPAGVYAGSGLVAGQFIYFASILLGFRSILIPWLCFEPYNYFAGVFFVLWIVFDMVHQRSLSEISSSQVPKLLRIFLLSFLLALVEQSCFFQFLSNVTITREPAIFDMQAGATVLQFYFTQISYLLGLLLGSLFFTFAFGFAFFALFQYCARLYARSYTRWRQHMNYGFLVLIMATNLTSFGYHGSDFLFASPIGFVAEDAALQKTVFTGLDLEDTYIKTEGTDPKPTIGFSGFAFDRGVYLRPNVDEEDNLKVSFEDFVFAGEHAWRSRKEFDTASWMERYKRRRGPTALRNAFRKLLKTDRLPPRRRPSLQRRNENAIGENRELLFQPTHDSNRDKKQIIKNKEGLVPPIDRNKAPSSNLRFDTQAAPTEEEQKPVSYSDLVRPPSRIEYQEEARKGLEPSFFSVDKKTQIKLVQQMRQLSGDSQSDSGIQSRTLQGQDKKNQQPLSDFRRMFDSERKVFGLSNSSSGNEDTLFAIIEDSRNGEERKSSQTHRKRRIYSLINHGYRGKFFSKVGFQNLFKRFYYSNPVYQALLSFDVDAFLNRQPNHYRITPTEEKMLFEKRQVLQQYYDSLLRYTLDLKEPTSNLNNLPSLEKLKPYSVAAASYSNRVYRQQFKGTLRTVRELFAITPSSKITSLSYDQPLFISKKRQTIRNQREVSYHEDLTGHQNTQDTEWSSAHNPLLKETNPFPLYTGWDAQRRALVVTNRFRPQWFNDMFLTSSNADPIFGKLMRLFEPNWGGRQKNKPQELEPLETIYSTTFKLWPASYHKLQGWPQSITKVETLFSFLKSKNSQQSHSSLSTPPTNLLTSSDTEYSQNFYNQLLPSDWSTNVDDADEATNNAKKPKTDDNAERNIIRIMPASTDGYDNYDLVLKDKRGQNGLVPSTVPFPSTMDPYKTDEDRLPPTRGGGFTWRENKSFPPRLKGLFSRFFPFLG